MNFYFTVKKLKKIIYQVYYLMQEDNTYSTIHSTPYKFHNSPATPHSPNSRIYKGIIMAKLQYGLVFSVNALQSDRKKIQVLQNRALRICTQSTRYVTNHSLHTSCNVLPISLRIKLDLLILMFKKIHSNGMQAQSQPKSQRFRNSVTYRPSLLGRVVTTHPTNLGLEWVQEVHKTEDEGWTQWNGQYLKHV